MTLHYNECVYVCERDGGGGAVPVTSRGVLFKGYKLVLSCIRLSIWGWLDILCKLQIPNERVLNGAVKPSELIYLVSHTCLILIFHSVVIEGAAELQLFKNWTV